MTRQEALQAAKPILFNTDMVRAILDGRKTVTRRPIRPKYMDNESGFQIVRNKSDNEIVGIEFLDEEECATRPLIPPYEFGDILYVREAWCKSYAAGGNGDFLYLYRANLPHANHIKWHPSIHMPKEAARIFLKVIDVRVVRLQDMTEEDAFKEGWSKPWCAHKVFEHYPDSPIPCDASDDSECPSDPPCSHSVPEQFGMCIWDKTIKKSDLDKYGWNANPWVWVIEFERLEVE